tara:strand:- start:1115 stop:1708 length:594 start_codon:yes stop_codon:yes gene_type:complete
MNKKKKGLFYTRYLQKQIYFRKNDVVNALFNLEKYLFENFEFNEDIPTSHIKQKWIYDCINENDYSNEISSQFKVFSERGLKKKILSLIDTFGQIPNISETNIFLCKFQMFNDKFNDLLISEGNYNFRTYIYFQIYYLFYSKKLKLEEKFENNIELNYDLVDIFETVFLKIFVKNKNYRIYKVFYLFQLLIRLIVKK